MWNPRIQIFFTAEAKTLFAIKVDGVGLGREKNAWQMPLLRRLHKGLQDASTNTLSTPGKEHGHATDMPIREEASSSNGLALRGLGECMYGPCVQTIPFQFDGDVLFLDEDGFTHGGEFVGRLIESKQAYRVVSLQ